MKKGMIATLLVLLISMVTISSCSKDDDGDQPTTCSNGVKDGDETGIDCGGSCSVCAASCTNGIKDGNETGVDCGGSCSACLPSITGKFYFKANVDGDSVIYQSSAFESTGSGSDGNGITCTLDLSGSITQSGIISGPRNGFEMVFNEVYTGACPAVNNQTTLNNLFQPGTYSFASGPNGSEINISYFVDDVRYSTSNFGSQPSSSTFEITNAVTTPAFGSSEGVKITALFNCKVKSSAGDVIEIKNATAVIAIYDWD